MKRRIVSITLALCMFVTMLPMTVFAAATPTISVESKTNKTQVGQTVAVNVIMKNNPGFTALGIEISYDKTVLELTKAAENGSVMPDESSFIPSGILSTPYRIIWENATSECTLDCANGVTLCTLTFKVLKEPTGGTTDIDVDVMGFGYTYNKSLQTVSFEGVSGSVSIGEETATEIKVSGKLPEGASYSTAVKNGKAIINVKSELSCYVVYSTDGGKTCTVIPAVANSTAGYDFTVDYNSNMTFTVVVKGDLTGDGKVNNSDVLRIKQVANHVGAAPTAIQSVAANVQGSYGTVNNQDVLKLKQVANHIGSIAW